MNRLLHHAPVLDIEGTSWVWMLTYMLDGKKKVERIPNEWMDAAARKSVRRTWVHMHFGQVSTNCDV